MDPERWQRIERLYHAALTRQGQARAAFLADACAGDEAMRREVEALLDTPATAEGLFATPALAVAAQVASEPVASVLTGRQLGVYQLQERIGAGGMGEVYRAHDTRLGRKVAIKILPRALTADRERLARFAREARVLASLNHPNIAAIYGVEVGTAEAGLPERALVLELVEGETLYERVQRSTVPVPEALAIASQIADALDAAHEKGIVHRDLKPANIKITPAGVVKLLDFGLAKAVARDGSGTELSHAPTLTVDATSHGLIVGTAAYMSPEQARGQVVDRRTDIWAFGCVLYELLTGRAAFARDTIADTLASVVEREPDWTALPSGTPASCRRLLQRCLHKDAGRRLRDIGDARYDIDESRLALDGGASPVSPDLRVHDIDFQRLTDFAGKKESPAISPDGKMVAFVAVTGGTRQIWIRLLAGGAALQVTRDHVDHEQPRWAPDSSTLIYYTPAAAHGGEGTIWEIGTLGGPPHRVASAICGGDISHNGRRIAVFQAVGEQVALMTLARDGSRGERVALLPAGATYLSPRWSPDDRSIAFPRGSSVSWDVWLEVVTVDGGARRQVACTGSLGGYCWRPDGTGFIYSSSQGNTSLYTPVFNLRTIDSDNRNDRQLTFGDQTYLSPDAQQRGKLVAGRIRSESDIWKFPVDGSPAENTRNAIRITRQTGNAQIPSVSPDDTEVVYLSDSGGHSNLWVARTDGSGARQITFERDPHVRIAAPHWSPAGDLIVFVTRHPESADLWAVRPDGGDLRPVVKNAWTPCFSGDGQWLYYRSLTEGAERIEKVPVAGGPPIVVRHEIGSRMPALSADGSALYFEIPLGLSIFGNWGADHEIRCARPENGPTEILARFAGGRVPVAPGMLQLMLSPDGRWIALPLMDGATTNIWALPTTGGPMKPLTDFGERFILIVRSVSWSPDSRHVYAAVAEAETDIILFDGLT